MTEIPPDLPASAAQASIQARETAKEREARRVGQADAASRQVRTVDEAGSTVETTDDDVAIFSDAEGAGSQGRESQEPADDGRAPEDRSRPDGIIEGEDGNLHIDVEA